MISRRHLIAAAGGATLLECGCRALPQAQISLLDYIPASQHGPIGQGRSTVDVTDHVQRAIDDCARSDATLLVPSGRYWLGPRWPLAHADPGFACLAALLLRSSMKLHAAAGAVFAMLPGSSSDGHPRAMAMWGTADVLEGVEIDGLAMDMNAAANPISPQRGDRIYSRFPQAHIFVSGGAGARAARIDRCRITHCRFTGSAGVSCIVAGQSNASDAVLGRDWLIAGNRFVDNGLDTDDHSSIFGQCDQMVVRDNLFENAKSYDGTGGNTAHEVHGSHHRLDRNVVRNYLRGTWISSSLSSPTVGTMVVDNRFETGFYGVDFFRDSDRLGRISNTVIRGNSFAFDDRSFPGLDLKAAVQIASPYTQSTIEMYGNTVTKTGRAIASAFLVVAQGDRGPGVHDRIDAHDNKGSGLTFGAFVRTSRTAGLGHLAFTNNHWQKLAPAGIFSIAAGYAVEQTTTPQPIRSLSIGGGSIAGDGERTSALFINAKIQSLSLTPASISGVQRTLVHGGADQIERLTGSIAAKRP